MRFEWLKLLIEGIVTNYKCPECNSKTDANHIEVLWIAGNNANLDIICPKCNTHSLFGTQMLQMNLNIDKFKKNLATNIQKISDKEITSLNKDLKKEKINVSDLFD